MPVVIVYWTATTLFCALYLSSAVLYILKRDFVRQAQADLGYSAAHLVPLMIVVKIAGPLAILSRLSLPLSDLAYAGMFFHLLLSGMAHLGVRKAKDAIPAFLGLAFLAASFGSQNFAREGVSPYAPAPSAHHITTEG